MRLFFFFVFATRIFASSFENMGPSTVEEVASSMQDVWIEGVIAPLSGQVAMQAEDLRVVGAKDVVLRRVYVMPHVRERYSEEGGTDQWMLGRALEGQGKNWVVMPHLWAKVMGLHFLLRDESGVVLQFEMRGGRGVLRGCGAGVSNLKGEVVDGRADLRNVELWVEGSRVRVVWPSGVERLYVLQREGLYRLEMEVGAEGKSLRYEYEGEELKRVVAGDIAGRWVYGWVEKRGEEYVGSDGREVRFGYEMREIGAKSREGRWKSDFKMNMLVRASGPVYTNEMEYDERLLLARVDRRAFPLSFEYGGSEGMRVTKVKTPSGETAFAYDPPIVGVRGGSTTVTLANGATRVYQYNERLLLVGVEEWFEGVLFQKRTFQYNKRQLVSQVKVQDGTGQMLWARCYEYDVAGDPILERLEGDFGVFETRKVFSRHRLVKEEREDGLGFEYSYVGNTHLVASKATRVKGEVLRKTVYLYDEANNLLEEREEGRKRIRYELYKEGRHLHRVEWKEVWDAEGQLQERTHFTYDKWGHCSEEVHYDATGQRAYELQRTYSRAGDLLKESNELGHVASYEYDERGRCVREVPLSQKLKIERTYDEKGRLTGLSEGDHVTSFAYNSRDELVEKVDWRGLKTRIQYHPVFGKPIRIQEGLSGPVKELIYDGLGREIERIEADGAVTKTVYDSHGNPVEILHPGGGKELFFYEPNGLLAVHVDRDGIKTRYTRDPLGRVIEEVRGDQKKKFGYNAYELIWEEDALGIVTRYAYDSMGRKREMVRDNRQIRYGYDALGFLAWEERGGWRISYRNDVLGRVLEENRGGKVKGSWTYDEAGNVASVCWGGCTYFTYDEHQRLIEILDPNGGKTRIFYEESEGTVVKRTIDPRGVEKIETENAQGLLIKREIPGCLLEEFGYDSMLRLNRIDQLEFGYTQEGQKAWMSEAGQRMTMWTYTPSGKVKTKKKPDGTFLTYEYNRQGLLAKVEGRQFHYDALHRLIDGSGFVRHLDAFGNVLKEEFGNGLSIESTYDDWDRPLTRTLPDQSKILYRYEGPLLKKVIRLDAKETVLYSHIYDEYDSAGHLLAETGPFTTRYAYDKGGRRIAQENPFFKEDLSYDEVGNLIRRGKTSYRYNNASELLQEHKAFSALYDDRYNRVECNGQTTAIDELNQLAELEYDPNGNLLEPQFVYDSFDQLIGVGDIKCTYDALGRRLTQGHTGYLYIDSEEIGSFGRRGVKELKIPGIVGPVAIELHTKPHAPVIDVQGTIRLLVDWRNGKVVEENKCDPFGLGLSSAIPYAYLGKRYDAHSDLVYFGKRYYSPKLGRWLTPDPMGAIDSSNLYQYVFNNPFAYRDEIGQFAFAIPLLIWGAEFALPALSAWAAPIVYGALAGATIYGSSKAIKALEKRESSDTNLPVPPYDGRELENDPSKPPRQGFEWKGPGKPGSKQGSWYNRETGESLHPDLKHPAPKKPHWDYDNPSGSKARLLTRAPNR